MAKQYRIYPGIGIARLGNNTDSFFLSPEVPGVGPLELTLDESVQPVRNYKSMGKLRRQGARFRIFEFDTAAPDVPVQEITAGNGIQIEWRVELANEKAAAGKFIDESQPEDPLQPRNPGLLQADLIIKPTFGPISGPNQTVKASPEGKFRGNDVHLGELRTDAKGRLIVLGGVGNSGPHGLPIGDGSIARSGRPNGFANNEEWFDDVSDGPVSATVRIPGEHDHVISNGGWVIVAPPDFAPYTNGVTTLYDIASQAAGVLAPATPSFQRDVLPIVDAAAGLRWVSAQPTFGAISTDYHKLSLKDDPNAGTQAAADQARQDTLNLLLSLENSTLANFVMTANQKQVLAAWANGIFVSDYNPNPTVPPLTPEGLDRASLSQGVGGGFFPGIEAGIRMTSPQMYSAPFRITESPFEYAGVQQIPHAGFITRTMACPWQSDFFECGTQSPTSVWWPAQRPIDVFVDAAAHTQKPWIDSIPNHQALVDKFWKLGLVLPLPDSQTDPLIEAERDATVPHI